MLNTMSFSIFTIVVAILLLLQIVMIVLHIDIIKTVKAGDKSDYHFGYRLNTLRTNVLRIGDKSVNVSNLNRLQVCGNSMKDYNIFDGQMVFVESIDLESAKFISNHPVLVFSLKKNETTRFRDSRLKLRKFVGYIDISSSCNDAFDTYRDRIQICKEDFCQEYNDRLKILKQDNNYLAKKYILSATFNEKRKKYHYSIHSTETVNGVVRYVL